MAPNLHRIRVAALSPDGRKAYTANGVSNDVSVIDLASGHDQGRAGAVGRGGQMIGASRPRAATRSTRSISPARMMTAASKLLTVGQTWRGTR